MRLLIVDTETTGIGDADDVCEIAVTLYQIGKSERTTGAIANSNSPLVEIKALVNCGNRELARDAGFS